MIEPTIQKLSPLIEQRADPFIFKHSDGYYYFTASVPSYSGVELRRAKTIAGLAQADAVMVWTKPDLGPYSDLIWAPEIHFNLGAWYVYFAAAPSRKIKDDLFQHRMYAIRCEAENPLAGEWIFEGRIESGIDAFCLDATTFTHNETLYYVWAQKEPDVPGNSNIMIAPMDTPTKIIGPATRLSIPEFAWETQGFAVNEGPAVIRRDNRIFVTYSASATDDRYCMGLLWADAKANLLDPASWHKSQKPVFTSNIEQRVFGPGHNSFTVSEDGRDTIMVYHARTYSEIAGDPLWDPNRHTFIKKIAWAEDGMPIFGDPAFSEY